MKTAKPTHRIEYEKDGKTIKFEWFTCGQCGADVTDTDRCPKCRTKVNWKAGEQE